MTKDSTINYIELPATSLEKAKAFYGKVFGWKFTDYGDDYCAFDDGHTDGGFYRSPLASNSDNGAALVVLYAENLETLAERISSNGGSIKKPIFPFPGGRRFHFVDPNQNELAVWTENPGQE